MTDPLVSVIIPVHAGSRFLDAALDSVFAQSYRRLETIVVDDGSPDDSAEIARRRAGVRVVQQRRGGVAAARNAGVAVARGDLLAFLDQDDQWRPGKIALQQDLLARRAEVGLVFTHAEVELKPGIPRPPWLEASRLTAPQPGFMPSTWLVRREVFARVGPFDASYEISCDSDWLARFEELGLVSVLLPDPLVRWHIHGANGSYDQRTMRRELIAVLRGKLARQREAPRDS